MEEDISSGKFFQGQYFNEFLNNDFILEAHSIFVQHCTRTKPLPDFSQQQKKSRGNIPPLWEAGMGQGTPGPRVGNFPAAAEVGVGCVPLCQLSMWHCSLPPVLHQGKDAQAPAQLKGMFMPLSQGLSHVFSTLNWHLTSTTSTDCRAMTQPLGVKADVTSPLGGRDADFGPDLSSLFLRSGWVGFAF